MTRGRVPVIRDPAVAVAVAKCWMARWHKGGGAKMVGIPVNSFHPQECGYCELPTDVLIAAATEFIKWSGLEPARATGQPKPAHAEVEAFLTLPRDEQSALVRRAQGYADPADLDDGPS